MLSSTSMDIYNDNEVDLIKLRTDTSSGQNVNANITPVDNCINSTRLDQIQDSYARLAKQYQLENPPVSEGNVTLIEQVVSYNQTLKEQISESFDSHSPTRETLISGDEQAAPVRKTGMLNEDPYLGLLLENRFLIETLLGQGGMGAVYLAQDQLIDRKVAIKMLHSDLISDKEMTARFIREARVAACVEHPNAILVYDFGLLPEGGGYIVMEFIQGRSLRDLIKDQISIPLVKTLEIMRQTCSAVAAAHQVGVVHRDLKPENIMLKNYDDEQINIKVIDLGLAKFIETVNQPHNNLTAKNEILGTPNYMSPEQCVSSKVDEQSDIYSLGIIFYELLSGETPFQGSYAAVMRKHLSEPVPRINGLDREIPAALEELIMKMLRKLKEERPSLAMILFQLDELDRALNPSAEPVTKPTEIATIKKIQAVDLKALLGR